MIEEGRFILPIQVPIHMVDSRVEMTPVSLFCILQESAAAHCDYFHLSGIDLKPYNLFWVLTRMHVQIERMPVWHEKLTIKTWEKPHSFISQPRDFLVFDEPFLGMTDDEYRAAAEYILNRRGTRPLLIASRNEPDIPDLRVIRMS